MAVKVKAQRVAEELGTSDRYVLRACDFPEDPLPCYLLPGRGGRRSVRRFDLDEVRAWAERHHIAAATADPADEPRSARGGRRRTPTPPLAVGGGGAR